MRRNDPARDDERDRGSRAIGMLVAFLLLLTGAWCCFGIEAAGGVLLGIGLLVFVTVLFWNQIGVHAKRRETLLALVPAMFVSLKTAETALRHANPMSPTLVLLEAVIEKARLAGAEETT